MRDGDMSSVLDILSRVPIPDVYRISYSVPTPKVSDVVSTIREAIERDDALRAVRPRHRIAIAVGSRGISNQDTVIAEIVRALKTRGAEVFIVPAMGSHAGAEASGQREMLEGLGISEKTVGAPIRSSMEVEQIGISESGLPVFVDANARHADGIVLVNRIKPHTAFVGDVESGLVKLAVIGLGKQRGAEICHELGFEHMAERIVEIAKVSFSELPILFGVALLENAFHETAEIHVLGPHEIRKQEPGLLKRSYDLMARIPFKKVDVLVLDQIGKEISGSGMDPNVTGRYHTGIGSGGPSVTRMAVLNISDASHGNGAGLGIADFTTKRAVDRFDRGATYPNILTSNTPISVKIPMTLPSDKLAIQGAIKTCLLADKKAVGLVRARDTLSVKSLEVSQALLPEVEADDRMSVLEGPYSLPFNAHGDLF